MPTFTAEDASKVPLGHALRATTSALKSLDDLLDIVPNAPTPELGQEVLDDVRKTANIIAQRLVAYLNGDWENVAKLHAQGDVYLTECIKRAEKHLADHLAQEQE
jgi:hypothetical protein